MYGRSGDRVQIDHQFNDRSVVCVNGHILNQMCEFNDVNSTDDVAHVWMIYGTMRSFTITPLVTVRAAEIHVSTCTVLKYFGTSTAKYFYLSEPLVGKSTKINV